VHVDAVRDDLDKIVLDAELLEAVLGTSDTKKKSKEIEIKISMRLRRHQGNPAYKTLSERLEALKERHEQGQLHSVEFLKELLDLARELLEVENATPPEKDEDRGKAALTELFEEARNKDTSEQFQRLMADNGVGPWRHGSPPR
jgi:type I restriction enzyme R subunit